MVSGDTRPLLTEPADQCAPRSKRGDDLWKDSPEGVKTMVISFKISTGAVATVHMHTHTIVCFGDAVGGRLKVDTTTTSGRK